MEKSIASVKMQVQENANAIKVSQIIKCTFFHEIQILNLCYSSLTA